VDKVQQVIEKAACNAWPLVEALRKLSQGFVMSPMANVELVVFENGGWAICSGDDAGIQVASAPLSISYTCVHDLEAALGETVDG